MKRIWFLGLFGVLYLCFSHDAWARPKKGLVIGCSIHWQDGVYPPESYNYEAFTHIIRTGIVNRADGSLSVPEGFFNPYLEKNAHRHGIKLLASLIGGFVSLDTWKADNWLLMARNPQAEKALFDNLEKVITDNHYDGVDIDWEPSALNDEDQATFTQFMKDLRARFPKWTISVFVVLGGEYWASHLSWAEIADQVDLVDLMAYDYAGSWHSRVTHNSNLYLPANPKADDISIDGSVTLAVGKYHLPPEKTTLGLAFYGREFLADKMGDSFPANSSPQGMEIQYREIAPFYEMKNYIALWDEAAKAPYFEKNGGGMVVTYDDAKATRLKCEYALAKGFKGVFMWVMGGDIMGDRTPLLDVVCQSMGAPPAPVPIEGLKKSFPFFVSEVKEARKKLVSAHDRLVTAGKTAEAKAADPGPDPDLATPVSMDVKELGEKILKMESLLTVYNRAAIRAQKEVDNLPAPQVTGTKLAPKNGNKLWVDDFEGKDSSKHLGGQWSAYCDHNNLGTTANPLPFVISEGGCPSSPGHAAHIWGHYGKSVAPWPFWDMSVPLYTNAKAVDLSEFTLVELWAKGDGKSYSLLLERAAVQDYAFFRNDFTAPSTWTKTILKLADFAQPSWGKKVPIQWTDVQNLSFNMAAGASDQDFDLWVDDIAFIQ